MSMHEVCDVSDDLRCLGDSGVHLLPEPAGKRVLARLGLAVPRGLVVRSAAAAREAAQAIGYPVAVKAAVAELPHKSDVGGVAGPLRAVEDVDSAAQRLLNAFSGAGGEVLVERWQDDGVPCFLALTLQSPFGSVLSFGLGGVWVETVRDIAHRLAPIDAEEAAGMIRSLRCSAIFAGGHGAPAVGTAQLTRTLVALSEVAEDETMRDVVSEIEINPLLAGPERSVAVDAKVTLRTAAGDDSSDERRKACLM